MTDKITVTVDKEIAQAVRMVQVLKDCGVINVNDELSSMDDLWDKLTESDKRFIAGMVKGSAAVLTRSRD